MLSNLAPTRGLAVEAMLLLISLASGFATHTGHDDDAATTPAPTPWSTPEATYGPWNMWTGSGAFEV